MKYYTRVPNMVFDELLAHLSGAELKIFLIIIRQTLGRQQPNRKATKKRDWISHSYFENQTGLSKRIISTSVKKLIIRRLIVAKNVKGEVLILPKDRKKTKKILYELAPRVLANVKSTVVSMQKMHCTK